MLVHTARDPNDFEPKHIIDFIGHLVLNTTVHFECKRAAQTFYKTSLFYPNEDRDMWVIWEQHERESK